ncbi:MAG: MFS transporter [Armatimonadetes bacterium]|nr:MFS transporter [Armatimonadota bacterium]
MPASAIPPTVRTLGWISFWADVSSELAYPILPRFIVGTLKAPSWTLGLIEGLAGLVIAVLRLWSGIRSDRLGRRTPYIRWGYGISVVAKPLVGLAASWPFVLVCRLADRVGKGIRTSSRDALIADSVEPAQSGRAFGFHRMMDTAGAFCGVSIGAAIVWRFPDALRTILLLTAFPGLIAVAITFLVRDADHHKAVSPTSALKFDLHLPKRIWILLGVLALFGLANSSDTYLLLYAGANGAAPYQVTLLYALFNLAYAISSSPLGSISDKIGSGRVLLVGWALFGVCYMLLSRSFGWGMVPVFALYGVAVAATDGVSKAFLVQQGVEIPKGTLIGAHYFIVGLVTLVGNLLAGAIWAKVSPEAMLVFGGGLALVSGVGLSLYLTAKAKA